MVRGGLQSCSSRYQEKWCDGAFSGPNRGRSFYLDVATPAEISEAIPFQPSSQSSGSSFLACPIALAVGCVCAAVCDYSGGRNDHSIVGRFCTSGGNEGLSVISIGVGLAYSPRMHRRLTCHR